MSKKLLLADDSVVIQKLVGLSFANENIEIFSTDNGDDAVSMAREVKPDVILADVVMPGLSGYEVCEAIRQDPTLSRIPVLLLTGTFEAFDERRANSAGANGKITKPFEAQALVERVTEAMNAPVSFEAEETIIAPLSLDYLSAAPELLEPTAVHESQTIDESQTNDGSQTIDESQTTDEHLFKSGPQELSADLTPILTSDAVPAANESPDPNEATASGLFGAPGEGATDELDTLGGSMALGQTMPANTANPDVISTEDATIAFVPEESLEMDPRSAIDAREPLPVARPVDLDAALDTTLNNEEPAILVATDDINATTSPNSSDPLSTNSPEPLAGGFEDLAVHVPSSDIDQDSAIAPSPTLLNADLLADATIVVDLDATLGNLSASQSAIGTDIAADIAADDAADDAADAGSQFDVGFGERANAETVGRADTEETIVRFSSGDDPLGLAPPNIASDDFGFDVSEQAAATTENDPMGESFSSLMDISESQILQGAGLHTPAAAPRVDPAAQAPTVEDSTPTESIVAGYDVSTSDLVTATGSTASTTPNDELGDSSPPLFSPDPLIDVPDLPEAFDAPISTESFEADTVVAEAADALITGNDDLFDALETGSPYEDAEPLLAVDPDDTLSSAGALDFGDDLLDADLSVSLPSHFGQPGAAANDFSAPAGDDFGASDPFAPVVEDQAPAAQSYDLPSADDDFSIGSISGMEAQSDGAAGPDRRVADLSPVMEQHIQETLEKVAWEAFSDLSESIVKQVMNRVEKIAWEVIPEMAETLVREEIRKMKGKNE